MRNILLTIGEDDFIRADTEYGLSDINDPYSELKVLNTERLSGNSEYIPLFLLFDPHRKIYLLFFCCKNDSKHLIQWDLSINLRYMNQGRVAAGVIFDLLKIFNIQVNLDWQKLAIEIPSCLLVLSHFMKPNLEENRLINFNVGNLSNSFVEVESVQGNWQFLNNFQKNWLCSIQELKPIIYELSASPVIAEKVLEMYSAWNNVTASHFNIDEFASRDLFDSGEIPEKGRRFFILLFNTWCINILKECFYFHNKRQLCFSPFTNKWMLSKKSIVATNKRGSYRCTLFEDENLDFIEISNFGFINSVSGYILPTFSFSFLKTSSVENPSTWFKDELVDQVFWNAAIDALRLAPDDAVKDIYLLFNSNTGGNLGHMLWNTISGIYSFEKVRSQLGYCIDYRIGVLGANIQSSSRFSEISNTDILIDFIKYNNQSTSPLLVIESHSHSSPSYSFVGDYLNISFKSLFVQKI